MGGTTLPDAYEVAISAENYLIQAGKIAPRPPIPFSPDLTDHQPIIAPILVDSKQPSQSSHASLNDLFEVKLLL